MNKQPDNPASLAKDLVQVLNVGLKPPKGASKEQRAEDAIYVERLRAYATTWLEAGYRLEEWSMRSILQRDIQTMMNTLVARPDGQPYLFSLYVSGDPKVTDAAIREGRALASRTFVRFITGPHYDHIGRCSRCETWFFSETGKRTRYCSLRCSRLDSSNVVKAASRERLVFSKIQRIQSALKEFEKLSKEERLAIALKIHGWKGWVAKKAGKGITTNFITRVVNDGRIDPPSNTQL
jgi:hypothetical protein